MNYKKMIATILALSVYCVTVCFRAKAEEFIKYEAEDSTYNDNMKVETVDDIKAVGRFSDSKDILTFLVTIEDTGSYNLIINSKGIGGSKINNVNVDGKFIATFESSDKSFSEYEMSSNYLTAGNHEISITSSWGWIYVDYLKIQKDKGISDSIYEEKQSLCNTDSTSTTKTLFNYLKSIYGKQILSGQVCDNGIDGPEFKAIYTETGKYPAILGLDFMGYEGARVEKGATSNSTDVAIKFVQEGGIVEFHWHWNAPNKYVKDGLDDNGNPRWWGGFYTSNTDLNISTVLDGTDTELKTLLDSDIEAIAKQILILKDNNIPILWRPLHESSGGWFWWGAQGAEPFKEFWKYLYDKLVNEYDCNNLIWVWTGDNADWYPGDEYVDIIGEDIYADKHSYNPSTSQFVKTLKVSKKMIALTETGTLFDIDKAYESNTKWLWFSVWVGQFIQKDGIYSEEYTEKDILKKDYQSDKVITLDELPDWNSLNKIK